MLRRLVYVLCSLPLLLGLALPCDAAELQLSEVALILVESWMLAINLN